MMTSRYAVSVVLLMLLLPGMALGQNKGPFQVSYRCASGNSGNLGFQGCLSEVGQKEQRCFFGTSFSNKGMNLDLGASFIVPKTSKPVIQSEVCLRSSGISAYGNSETDLAINSSSGSRSASSSIATTLANCPVFLKVGRPFGINLDFFQSVNSASISSGADCELTIANFASYRK